MAIGDRRLLFTRFFLLVPKLQFWKRQPFETLFPSLRCDSKISYFSAASEGNRVSKTRH